MAAISLSKLNKHYGSLFHAVKDVDLEIADKEFVALVGPSGCGKSTTLRMIAGLEDITSGDIRIGDRVVNHLPPRDRDIAMVFQNYALYQHMSVYDNLAFGLRNKKTPEAEIKAAIDRAAGMLGLHELLQRKPKQLSGGQQQRVALGRCIVRNPQVFLFDEPLSNLDAKLRAQMRIEIKRLHAAIPTTSVFVTHDQVEAMTLGDRVVIMRDGRVQQIGTPLQVYGKPANKFVAGFIGAPAMNFVDVTVRSEAGATAVEAAGLKLTVGDADARALAAYNGKPRDHGRAARASRARRRRAGPKLRCPRRGRRAARLRDPARDQGRQPQRHGGPRARGDRDRQRRSGPRLGAARPAAFLRSGDRAADYGLKLVCSVIAGLDPAIHRLRIDRPKMDGCPGQARACTELTASPHRSGWQTLPWSGCAFPATSHIPAPNPRICG